MTDSDQAGTGNLRTVYSELCQTHRSITDFRAKLLALLPLASGTGIFLLLTRKSEPLDTAHLGAIGIFGFLVTLGLFLHELRGIGQCGELIGVGKTLEHQLGLDEGPFSLEDKYYSSRLRNIIGRVGAAWVIYPVLLAAWLYVAILPVAQPCGG